MTDASKQQTLADALGHLVGGVLSSVEFVADYVQLRFNGPCMTAYTPPIVTRGSQSVGIGQPGYRDALCDEIGRRVERAEISDRRVSILFENGVAVSISLRDDDYRGAEALQFSLDDDDRIWVA
jgi:hypothetical protein